MSTPDLPPSSVPASAPVPPKKSNTLLIVLGVIFGIFFLILASCVGTCMYVGKKATEYAKESEKNPQISALALAAAIHPGIEVVSKDLDAGTLVLKNQKTGEIVRLNAKDFSSDKIAVLLDRIAHSKDVSSALKTNPTDGTARSENAVEKTRSTDGSETHADNTPDAATRNAALKSFSSDFPVYSSGGVNTIEASRNEFAGITTSQHAFETNDLPKKVADFYDNKLTAEGYTAIVNENGTDDNGPKLSRVFQKGGVGTTITIDVHVENGKTHVEMSQVLLKQ